MNKKQLVLSRMKSKPGVKSLGFDKKELMGVAATIADNLTSDDEASEDEVNAEIDKAIDAVLPYLQLAQSQANRAIEAFKKKHETDDDDIEEGEEDDPKPLKSQKKTTQPKKNDADEDFKTKVLGMLNKMQEEITSFKGEKVADMRKQKLEALLKDAGAFGSRTLKSFAKMSFENDDEFEEFYSDVEKDLKEFNQERADAGLSSLGSFPGVTSKKVKEEPFSDEEIAALAED